MSKITLPTITNGQDLTTLNSNFQSIATQLNTNVFYRTNIVGEPNTLSQDTDFNGFKLYNVSDVTINGISIAAEATVAQSAATQAAASATNAINASNASSASATASQASAVQAAAAAGASGSLIAVNNLSDVPNKTTARLNLLLDQVTNTSDANKPVSAATQTALNLKLDISSAASTYATITNLALKAPLASANPTGTWSFAGLISPSSTIGIKGTIAADSAQAGSVGEYITATASSISLPAAGTATNVTSISLTAGDWDVDGLVQILAGAGNTMTFPTTGISTTTGAIGVLGTYVQSGATFGTASSWTNNTPTVRISIAATTTVFLVAQCNNSPSASTASGVIRARRIR